MRVRWWPRQRVFFMSDHDHNHGAHPHQLEPPHEAFHNPQSGEVMRAWIVGGGLSLSMNAMAFGKAETWGHVLAGIVQQISDACEEMGHGTRASNFTDISKALTTDLDKMAQSLPKS